MIYPEWTSELAQLPLEADLQTASSSPRFTAGGLAGLMSESLAVPVPVRLATTAAHFLEKCGS